MAKIESQGRGRAPSNGSAVMLEDAAASRARPEAATETERDEVLERLDGMERELADMRRRIATLHEAVELDPWLPLLGRRAFLARATKACTEFRRSASGNPGALLYVVVEDLEAVRRERGDSAVDAALGRLAVILGASLREGDAVGRLGRKEFAALLPRASVEVALAKGKDVEKRFKARPAGSLDDFVPARAATIAVSLDAAETVHDLVGVAANTMRGRVGKSANGEIGKGDDHG